MTEPRTMLITGGGRGLGAVIARQATAAGFHVCINYSASGDAAQALAAELGATAWSVQADISDEAQVLDMFAQVDARWPRVHCLVNNAGVSGPYGTLDTVDQSMLSTVFGINVIGAFLCTREAVSRMPAAPAGGGVIVNISSKAAVLGGPNEWVHYAASKGALESMTTGLARELAPRNIRVNAVRPGLVAHNFGTAPDDRVERLTPMIPMQRAGELTEVAEVVVWLADQAPAYLTGTFIDVTGGR